jgi:hypothetical protein
MRWPHPALLIAWTLAATCVSPLPSRARAAEAGSTTSPSFPVTFRGDWYDEPGPCNRDKVALHIGARSLNYFDEFSGRLAHIIGQSDYSVHYTAEYSAEGHRWNATETLRLSLKGNELRLEPERTSPRYFRCTIADE